MKYISTRGTAPALNFEEVLLTGLASDGGLYLPELWPQIPQSQIDTFKDKSYVEVAFEVMYPFVEGAISPADFKAIIQETYSDKIFDGARVAPLYALSRDLYIMELFHGPTLAFKDVALQLLGRLFDHVLKKRNEYVTIVGATSGDTGSAAIEGCRNSDRTNIFILYPHNRVSDVQRRQMTTVDAPNVKNIALEGTFDDCQALVKALFNDAPFRKKVNLSAVNSINWARIMAQIVYYFYAATRPEMAGKQITFTVPTGNFGNVFAGYAAQKMGLNIRLAIATNRNDILTRFFETGEMKKAGVYPTISPSMDIEISSNFERYLFELLDRDAGALAALMKQFSEAGNFKLDYTLMKKANTEFKAFRCSEEETRATMQEIYEENNYILDPHSAIGVHAASQLLGSKEHAVIALATAHPAKFPEAVARATGQHPSLPAHLADLMARAEKFTVLPNDVTGLKDFITR